MNKFARALGLLSLITLLFLLGIFHQNAPANKQLNDTVPGPNLLLNPSIESSTTNWNQGKWGTNTTAFAYNATGHTGSHSISVTMSKRTSGDAKWFPDPVAVTPSTSYTFSDWYQSTVASEIDAVVTSTTGQVSYMWLASTPASSAWTNKSVTFTTPANAAKVTFYHVINKVGTLTTDDYSFGLASVTTPTTPTPPPVIVPPAPVTPTPPTVSLTSPTAGSSVKGTKTVTSTVTDAQGIASVQYKLDGVNLGSPVTTAPYSYNWNTTTVANGTHTLSAVATNTVNLSTTSSTVSFTVANPTPPTISITAPVAASTVTGTQSVTANITDAQGIASVQYKLDGVNLGSPVTTAPYSYNWNTTTATNGAHTLSAVVTNTVGLTATAANVSVNVNNVVVTPPSTGVAVNTVPNPSFETADATGTKPQDWTADSWGTNTAAFTYNTTGRTGNRSVTATVSGYSSGSANWDYTMQAVTPGGHYRYTDWYKSTATTEIDAAVTINGVVSYYYLGTVLPSTNWAQASAEFDIPAGATSVTIFHLIAANGSLTIDDASFGLYTPSQFSRGIVSLTFDDGWTNQYTNALPLLNKYGQKATFYIIAGELNDQPDYMSTIQVKALVTGGHEIASHSVTHPDLTTLSATKYKAEMKNSQTTLQNAIGVPITNFAYPFGAYNANTVNFGKTIYVSQRTVATGYNTKDNLDFTKLLVQNVYNTTTPAQVKAWVDQAIAQHTWLILVWHEVATTPTDPTDVEYNTQPSDLDAELSYIKSSGISVQTVQQAISEVVSQH
ncbi:MAG: Ig-like domain-containing protein [Patescibacteria group bacterium]